MHSEDFDLSIDDILTQFTGEPAAPADALSAAPAPLQAEAELPAPVPEQSDLSAEDTAIFPTVPTDGQEDKITHFADKYKRQPTQEEEEKPFRLSRMEKDRAAAAPKEAMGSRYVFAIQTPREVFFCPNACPAVMEETPAIVLGAAAGLMSTS